MSIKEDYQRAKGLAKDGEFEAAHAILKKHKGANKQIDTIIAQLEGRLTIKKKRPLWQTITLYATVTVVICGAIFGGLRLYSYWQYQARGGAAYYDKLFSAISVCSYIEVYTEIESCDHEKLLDLYSTAVNYCYQKYGEIPTGVKQVRDQWIDCLLKEDVVFLILTED